MIDKFKFFLFLALFFVLCSGDLRAIARHNHAMAVLPDGNFISCGGIDAGGVNARNDCDLYDTKTNAVTNPAFGGARAYHTLTVLSDGRVLAAGGITIVGGAPLRTAAVFNGTAWAAINGGADVMMSARANHTATLITRGADAGNVLICGGQTTAVYPGSITNTCEIFITTAAASPWFKTTTAMSTSRMAHTSTLLNNGKILLSGGINSSGYYMSTQEMYDNITRTFWPAAALTEARAYHNAVGLNNGSVLIIGGYNPTNLADKFSEDLPAVQVRQNQGTQGYLESMELFSANGARMAIGGEEYYVMPYRISRNSAILLPDGKVDMIGGYGNIPVSYFEMTPEVDEGSYLNVSSVFTGQATGIRTANLTGGAVSFEVDTNLSRAVTARIVEGDMFFSNPTDPTQPAFSMSNIEAYNLGNSTAVIDGDWIGTEHGGRFLNTVTLSNLGQISPSAYVKFTPVDTTATNAILDAGTINFTPSPLALAQSGLLLNSSSITVDLVFKIPGIYAQGGVTVTGTVTVRSANIAYTNLSTPTIRASIAIGGAGGIDSGYGNVVNAPVTAAYENGVLVGVVTVNNVVITGLEGDITNNSENDTLDSGLDVSDQLLQNLNIEFSFTPNRVYLTLPDQNEPTTFAVGRSTAVIRQAIFADETHFSPKEALWSFNDVYAPIFDHATILTPAADVYTRGGRNCENNVPADCERATPGFTARDISGVVIMQNWTAWPRESILKTKRAFHTSTLLPDGNILNCGGTDGLRTLSSCELYFKGTDTSVFVSSMTSPRAFHTATLLSNGNVLIAGGTDGSSENSPALKSAEIYYPDTYRFVKTSSMTVERMMHTATMLADGNIVVIGGSSNGSYLNSAEVYISTAEAWQPVTATLTNRRSQHTATFMKNNTILIAGGVNGGGVLNSAETFNPANRTFAAAPGDPTMNSRRVWHTANLLKDGRVIVIGGSDSGGIAGDSGILDTSEIYDGASWTLVENMPNGGNKNLAPRARHTSTLLPNGKLMIVGGERPSLPHSFAEGFDVDFSTFQYQGETEYRTGHTTVLISTGYLFAIGGYDGTQYLDTIDKLYFTYEPDSQGLDAFTERHPFISTATEYIDRGTRLTLLSSATNFHGITEASGGGGGVRNGSFSNPRLYLNAVDNPSSFLVDLTTRIYASNPTWEKTLSSITVNLPLNPGELPYGWYHLHVCDNGQFSDGFLVQITSERPKNKIAGPILGETQSTTTIKWNWYLGALTLSDGYAIFSSSDNVFISTMALVDPVTFYQSGLTPNTAVSIKVTGYNMGGYGTEFVKSATYYTFANPPKNIQITRASFETAEVTWDPNGNSDFTAYELSLSPNSDFSASVSTPVRFDDNHVSTSAEITGLTPDLIYYFRVRAKNNSNPAVYTVFDDSYTAGTPVSTATVSAIINLKGTPLSVSSIRWDWDEGEGADGYQLYKLGVAMDTLKVSTENPVFIASTSYNYFTQTDLSTNTFYAVMVFAFKDMPPLGSFVNDIQGPPTVSTVTFTLASKPLPNEPNVFTNVQADRFTVNWQANGNPYYTLYGVAISTCNSPESYSTYTVTATSLTLTSLSPNYPYYTRLVAVNGDDILSPIADLGVKYTRAKPPSDVLAATVTMSGVTINWDTQSNSTFTTYEVRGTTVPPE
ncbi:MAG: hypothetical protein COT18_07660, partial [Elusimicrobia bacterium CG08_land_8_20_14_0_20_59_10]